MSKAVKLNQPKERAPKGRSAQQVKNRLQPEKGKVNQPKNSQVSQAERQRGRWIAKSQSGQIQYPKPNMSKPQYTHENPPRILKRKVVKSVSSQTTWIPKTQLGKGKLLQPNSKKAVKQEWRPTGVIFSLGPI